MPDVARTPAQRGPFGRWLTAAREARYERQSDALAAMKRLAGLHLSPSEYAQWESGSRVPRPDNPKVERLYEFFGSRPEDDETGPSAVGEAGILAQAIREAISEQTQVFRELLLELRTFREQQVAFLRGIAGEPPERPMPSPDLAPAPHVDAPPVEQR